MQTLQVWSPAFGANGSIPSEHTCEGADVAPPLEWTPAPAGTKSIAIVVEDVDAPDGVFVHWIATGIPGDATAVGDRVVHGSNSWGNRGWNGPCPPSGRHRYFFRVYALDIALETPGLSKPDLVSGIDGHVLAQGELIGTYEKAPEKRSASIAPERRAPH